MTGDGVNLLALRGSFLSKSRADETLEYRRLPGFVHDKQEKFSPGLGRPQQAFAASFYYVVKSIDFNLKREYEKQISETLASGWKG